MFKQILVLAALVLGSIFTTAPAQAQMVRCQLANGQWTMCRAGGYAPAPRRSVVIAPRINLGAPAPRPVMVRGTAGYQEESMYSERVVRGPKYGKAAGDFPVAGIREGEQFDGVSNPDAAARCLDEKGGRLVAHFVKILPNGQSMYKNTCE